ncbi:MAG: DUF2723 domain-containing protein [Acidobacteria bacterium]|nr:DUF2723 domain-containing protein [Acidobacteriota bacterium]
MIRSSKLEPLLFAAAVGLSRYSLRSHRLYDLDSVNFALGIERFSPQLHQPHPPGYFLYICIARLVNFFVHDANLALVLVSVAASCGAIAMVYRLTLDWFGPLEARFASMVFFFSPLGWFHGIVALTYSVEAFFSAAVAYLCWRINLGGLTSTLPAAVTLGISAGVRPSSLLFLGPLYLYSLRGVPIGKRLSAVMMLAVVLAAWFIPMIVLSGGPHAYFEALFALWKAVPAKGTIFNSSPANSLARVFVVLFIGLLMCGSSSLALSIPLLRTGTADAIKTRFTLVWIAPALCFYTLVFLKFVNSGYLLLLLPPIGIWFGHWLASWYRETTLSAVGKLTLIAACAVTNTFIFLASPLYCSYRSVRQFEDQLQSVTVAFPFAASSGDTLIVGFDSHFLGYRHAGYYFPGYLTLEYPAVRFPEGARVFSLEDRKTRLLSELPQGNYRRFVFFPLPTDDPAYGAYMDKVKRLLPEKSLEVQRVGSHEFVGGPISILPLLFPAITQASKVGVYPPHHSGAGDVYTNVNTVPHEAPPVHTETP